jgi:hypothetical protein
MIHHILLDDSTKAPLLLPVPASSRPASPSLSHVLHLWQERVVQMSSQEIFVYVADH